ncbi:MAG: serine protease [Caldimonas sp.]
MEWQRVVELHSGADEGSHGSGYLLATGLVLTARHVVDGLDATEVRLLTADEDGLPGDVGEWQVAQVAWRGGADLDLALLTPAADAAPFRDTTSAATIARLDGRAPVRVDALGFPRAMLSPTHSDTLHLEAAIDAWSGVRGEDLLLDVRTTRPVDDEGWKGMSGAAVFAGDRLVGVVAAVPAKLDASTLRATPAHVMFEVEAAASLLRNAGVALASQFVDAAYVEKLPRVGHWGGVREQYARAVVTALCRIDHVGLGVSGAPDRRTPALASFTERRLGPWPRGSTR